MWSFSKVGTRFHVAVRLQGVPAAQSRLMAAPTEILGGQRI